MTPQTPTTCSLCGEPKGMAYTARCDRCWELERRIEADPDIAKKIIARVTAPKWLKAFRAYRKRLLYAYTYGHDQLNWFQMALVRSELKRRGLHNIRP
jgi:hypothetical protein